MIYSNVFVREDDSTMPMSFSAKQFFPQKMKFSIEDFFNKWDQIRMKLRNWSHLLRKFLMEKFIFCTVYISLYLFKRMNPQRQWVFVVHFFPGAVLSRWHRYSHCTCLNEKIHSISDEFSENTFLNSHCNLYINCLNHFFSQCSLLILLKASENFWSCGVFQGINRKHWEEKG